MCSRTRSADHWNTIVDALHQLRRGGAVVVMDDESRENEVSALPETR
jgi:3,4-dihydroxy-2-butanone 4-phosphate synthase